MTPLKAKNGTIDSTGNDDDNNNMNKRESEDHNVSDDHTNKKKKSDDSIQPDSVVSMVNSLVAGGHHGHEMDEDEEEYGEVPWGQYPTYIHLDHILNKLGSGPCQQDRKGESVVLGKLDSLLTFLTDASVDFIMPFTLSDRTPSAPAASFVKDFVDLGGPFRMIMFLRRNMKDPIILSRSAQICSMCLDLHVIHDSSRLATERIFVDRDGLRIFILAIEEVGHNSKNEDWSKARLSLWSTLLKHILYISHNLTFDFEKILIVAEVIYDYLRLNHGEWQADVFRDICKILCVLLRSYKKEMRRFCTSNFLCDTLLRHLETNESVWQSNLCVVLATVRLGEEYVEGRMGTTKRSNKQRWALIAAKVTDMYVHNLVLMENVVHRITLPLIKKVFEKIPPTVKSETKKEVCRILIGMIQLTANHADGDVRHQLQEVLSILQPPK